MKDIPFGYKTDRGGPTPVGLLAALVATDWCGRLTVLWFVVDWCRVFLERSEKRERKRISGSRAIEFVVKSASSSPRESQGYIAFPHCNLYYYRYTTTLTFNSTTFNNTTGTFNSTKTIYQYNDGIVRQSNAL